MDDLKRLHKQETKDLNLSCDIRLLGKKGPERKQEERSIADDKKSVSQRQSDELNALEAILAVAVVGEQPDQEESTLEESRKPTRAMLRARKKASEEERAKEKLKEAVALAKASGGPNRRDVEMSTLVKKLLAMRMRINEINPDGNCLFGAVAHQMRLRDGKQYTVDELRKVAMEEMKDNPALFVPFLPDGETLETYGKKMTKNGEWGGELEIRAMARALGRQIWVHRYNLPIVKMGQDEVKDETGALHLTFHEHQYSLGEHYNSTMPIENRSTAQSEF